MLTNFQMKERWQVSSLIRSLSLLITFFGFAFLMPSKLSAQSAKPENEKAGVLMTKENMSGLKVYGGGEYFKLEIDKDHKITNVGTAGGAQFGLKKNMSLYLELRQGYSSENVFTTLFSSLSSGLTLALSGSLSGKNTVISNEQGPLVSYNNKESDGLRLSLGLSQYLFNAGDKTFSFGGFSTAIGYEQTITEKISLTAGVGIDRISNGKSTLLPLRLLLRVNYSIY